MFKHKISTAWSAERNHLLRNHGTPPVQLALTFGTNTLHKIHSSTVFIEDAISILIVHSLYELILYQMSFTAGTYQQLLFSPEQLADRVFPVIIHIHVTTYQCCWRLKAQFTFISSCFFSSCAARTVLSTIILKPIGLVGHVGFGVFFKKWQEQLAFLTICLCSNAPRWTSLWLGPLRHCREINSWSWGRSVLLRTSVNLFLFFPSFTKGK